MDGGLCVREAAHDDHRYLRDESTTDGVCEAHMGICEGEVQLVTIGFDIGHGGQTGHGHGHGHVIGGRGCLP